MKTTAFVLLATAACAVSTAAGAECTLTQQNQIESVAQKVGTTSACKKYSNAGTSSAVSMEICSDSACLSAIRSSVAQYPSCSIQGIDIKAAVKLAVDSCETFANSDMDTTVTTPTTRTPTSTSTSTLRTPTPTATSASDTTSNNSPILPGLGGGSTSDASSQQQRASTALVATSLAAVAYAVFA